MASELPHDTATGLRYIGGQRSSRRGSVWLTQQRQETHLDDLHRRVARLQLNPVFLDHFRLLGVLDHADDDGRRIHCSMAGAGKSSCLSRASHLPATNKAPSLHCKSRCNSNTTSGRTAYLLGRHGCPQTPDRCPKPLTERHRTVDRQVKDTAMASIEISNNQAGKRTKKEEVSSQAADRHAHTFIYRGSFITNDPPEEMPAP